MFPSIKTRLTASILCICTAVAGCGPTEADKTATNVPDRENLIDQRDISAVSKDQTGALRAELANTSFLIRMA